MGLDTPPLGNRPVYRSSRERVTHSILVLTAVRKYLMNPTLFSLVSLEWASFKLGWRRPKLELPDLYNALYSGDTILFPYYPHTLFFSCAKISL